MGFGVCRCHAYHRRVRPDPLPAPLCHPWRAQDSKVEQRPIQHALPVDLAHMEHLPPHNPDLAVLLPGHGRFSTPFLWISLIWNTFLLTTLISPYYFPVTADTFNYAPVIFGAVTIFGFVAYLTFPEEKWLSNRQIQMVKDNEAYSKKANRVGIKDRDGKGTAAAAAVTKSASDEGHDGHKTL